MSSNKNCKFNRTALATTITTILGTLATNANANITQTYLLTNGSSTLAENRNPDLHSATITSPITDETATMQDVLNSYLNAYYSNDPTINPSDFKLYYISTENPNELAVVDLDANLGQWVNTNNVTRYFVTQSSFNPTPIALEKTTGTYENQTFGSGNVLNAGTTSTPVTISIIGSFVINLTAPSSADAKGTFITQSPNNVIDIKNSVFINNSGTTSGPIYLNGTDNSNAINPSVNNRNTNSISSSYFYENKATASGGAIDTSAILNVDQSYFDRNTAGANGGAIQFSERGQGSVTYSEFVYNKAQNGGAIYTKGIVDSIANSIFSNNSAVNGGAIYSAYNGVFNNDDYLINNTFTANSAITNGGALYIDLTANENSNKALLLKNSQFIENKAGKGGAIYLVNNASFSGSITKP